MVGTRIKQLRLSANLTQKAFANIFSLSESMVSLYESGNRQPSYDVLSKIAQQFNVTTDYLIGNDSMLKSKRGVKIPVLGRVPAGIPVEAVENVIDWEEIPAEWTKNGDEYFALQVKGDSMFPKYLEGDNLIIKKQSCCDSGDDAVIIVNGNDATLKKTIINEGGIILQPLNPAYAPMFFSAKDVDDMPVIILGVVVELRRKIK